ncbi:hypothetical protein WA158_005165 [Blastocystis sp. Blastoise]
MASKISMKYLSQSLAIALDKELMSVPGFSIDQLMELAGLSVASAIEHCYDSNTYKNVLVICGPGNNGGDGLVAARHLKHFGYNPQILYPKQKKGNQEQLFNNLVYQLNSLHVPFITEIPSMDCIRSQFQLIVDGIFGFSFSGIPRSPFDEIISTINESSIPIVSIDVPSGWDVDQGPLSNKCVQSPDMLISLTCPKPCSQFFKGSFHALGGRFVPSDLMKKYDLVLPKYFGSSQYVMLSD